MMCRTALDAFLMNEAQMRRYAGYRPVRREDIDTWREGNPLLRALRRLMRRPRILWVVYVPMWLNGDTPFTHEARLTFDTTPAGIEVITLRTKEGVMRHIRLLELLGHMPYKQGEPFTVYLVKERNT